VLARGKHPIPYSSGPAVSKVNFLGVYAKAHARAFTKENILATFRKTGMVPLVATIVYKIHKANASTPISLKPIKSKI
jgi:hypothetical protein